ncbi:MAG: DUF6323 family protein [Acetanaerobacterium sp.]
MADFSYLPMAVLQELSVSEIVAQNDLTCRYGLTLTHAEATELVQTRNKALADNGRVEFGGGIVEKMIAAFCDSPYLSQRDYAPALHELVELFYYFKNETLDEVSDDELIDSMKDAFDHTCFGSLELLADRELEALARAIRFGGTQEPEEPEETFEEEEDWN